jgi:hypothetical protein
VEEDDDRSVVSQNEPEQRTKVETDKEQTVPVDADEIAETDEPRATGENPGDLEDKPMM